MGIIPKKKSNTINTNENYTIGGLVFPCCDLFGVLHNINKLLSLFYTETGEEYDYEPIFDSDTRRYDFDEFDKICKMINSDISFLKDLAKHDRRVSEFLHNNRLSNKFSSLFGSIYNAFIESSYCGGNNNEIKKKQYKKINEIVKKLAYIGVDPFTPLMV